MKILMVTPDLPAPATSGGRVRTFHLLRELGRWHEMDVLAPALPEPGEVTASREVCRHLTLYPWVKESSSVRRSRVWRSLVTGRLHHAQPAVRDQLFHLLTHNAYDVLHFITPYLFPSLPRDLRAPALVDFFGTSIGIRREIGSLVDPMARLKALARYRFALRGERRVLARVDAALAISGTDRAFLANLAPEARIEVVPNGVDADYFRPREGLEEADRLAFVGDMGFRPNVEGASFLVKEILPRVRAVRPRARVDLVGRNPAPEVAALAQRDAVQVTGTVEDVRPFMSRAAVIVVPLLGGSGVRNKTLEAMAMRRAVVSTSMGVEGLEALQNDDVMVADRPEEMARAVIALLSSPERRARMGRVGRERVLEHYSWEASARQVESLYRSLSENKRQTDSHA